MEPESGSTPERAYPYRTGWQAVGCAVLFFGLIGGIGVSLFPTGVEKFQAGQLPTGIALIVIALFGLPTLAMALWTLFKGVSDAVRPPLLRVTTTALLLPPNLLESTAVEEHDERGVPYRRPAHPAELPFAALRWARREGPPNPGSDKLLVVHDLSAHTLVIEQAMMKQADFDELESVLHAARPDVFTTAPQTR
jgi:hypothetical protein